MKRFLCLMTILACLWPVLNRAATKDVADVPPDMSMLANKASLRSYLSSQVAGGSVYISSSVMQSTNAVPYVDINTNADVLKMLGILGQQVLTYELMHPSSDQVRASCLLRDKDWRILFWGASDPFALIDNGHGGWVLPAGAGNIKVRKASWVPIYVGQRFSGAQFLPTAVDGSYLGYSQWFEVDERGYLSFYSEFVGGGDLVLRDINGGLYHFDLRNGGQRVVAEMQSLQVHPVSDEFIEIPETIGRFILNPISNDGEGEAQVIRLTITSDKTIQLGGMTTEGEKATVIWVRNLNGTGVPEAYEIMNGASHISVEFVPGEYEIYFGWPKFDRLNPERFRWDLG